MDTPFELNQNTVTATQAANGTNADVAVPAGALTVRVYNAGPNLAYLKGGQAGVAATVNDVPLPAGLVEVFGVQGCQSIGVISAGTSAVTFSFGWGT